MRNDTRRLLGERRLATALLAMTALTPFIALPAMAQEAELIEEVLVTAQKREASVKEVPSAITVLSAARLEQQGASQLSDYVGYVPGLTNTGGSAPGQNSLILRGLTTDTIATATVGTYVDETPYGTARGQGRFTLDLMPYDIQRIEVLRGPQGTLYGASTLGGLLKYVTTAPDSTAMEFRVGAEYLGISHGDTGGSFRVSANVPLITDKVAVRASYYNQTNPGYVDAVGGPKDANSGSQEGGRVSIKLDPTENFTVRVTAAVQELHNDDSGVINVLPSASKVAKDRRTVYGDYAHKTLVPGAYDQRVEIYSANMNYDLGWASITSDTSLSKSATHTITDNSAIYTPILTPLLGPVGTVITVDQASEKVTQELRLTSNPSERFEWLVGLYYTDEDNKGSQLLTALTPAGGAFPGPIGAVGGLAKVSNPSTFQETAIFGDATWKFSDKFDVEFGLRFSENKQTTRQASQGLLFGRATDISGRSSEQVTTYAISPRYKLSDDVMIYGRIASGYRPGGPNTVFPGQIVPAAYDADTVVNYEAGIKGFWLDRTLSIDADVFYIDWDNIQITQVFGGVQGLGNGKTARSQGVEFSSVYYPVNGLSLGLNVAYTDAQLTADAPSISGKAGDPVPYVPKWAGSATIDYHRAAFGDYEWRVGLGYRYKGENAGFFPSSPNYSKLSAYGLIDLNAALEGPTWTFSAFARNLADVREYIGGALPNQLIINQPRVLGVGLSARF